jgi:hypothetical protein
MNFEANRGGAVSILGGVHQNCRKTIEKETNGPGAGQLSWIHGLWFGLNKNRKR